MRHERLFLVVPVLILSAVAVSAPGRGADRKTGGLTPLKGVAVPAITQDETLATIRERWSDSLVTELPDVPGRFLVRDKQRMFFLKVPRRTFYRLKGKSDAVSGATSKKKKGAIHLTGPAVDDRPGLIVWVPNRDRKQPVVSAERAFRWVTASLGRRDCLLMVPFGKNGEAFSSDDTLEDDVRYIVGAAKSLIRHYQLDPRRVVITGHAGGGRVAYVAGLRNQDVFRAVVASCAPLVIDPGKPSRRGYPVGIIACRTDPNVPFSHARKVSETLQKRGYAVKTFLAGYADDPGPRSITVPEELIGRLGAGR